MPRPKHKRSTRIRASQTERIAKDAGLTAEQIAHGGLVVCDVANHSTDDQRRMESLKQTRTVRKLSRIELMARAGVITAEQALACGWYAAAHETGFQTLGCTANYTGAGGSGFGSQHLLARYKAQKEGRENYFYARSAIPAHLLETFEGIVLGTGRPPQMLPRAEKTRFSLAAFLLHQQIGHMLTIAA